MKDQGKNLDSHGQPLEIRFNLKRNREKAVYSLRGILLGVLAEKKLNEQEIVFLDAWLKSQDNIQHEGDVVDLLNAIKYILDDGVVTAEEMEDLIGVMDTIIEFGQQSSVEVEGLINELLGLLNGIAVDSVLELEEVSTLKDWISCFQDTHDSWPVNMLIPRLEKIVFDGRIDSEEGSDLLKTLQMVTGNSFEKNGIACGMAASAFSFDIESFNCDGQKVCFTGRFLSGTRKELHARSI